MKPRSTFRRQRRPRVVVFYEDDTATRRERDGDPYERSALARIDHRAFLVIYQLECDVCMPSAELTP